MNKHKILAALAALAAGAVTAYAAVLKDPATGREGAWYGANYTTPFAHAYRALGYLGADRKEAIRKDSYHLSRLGLNAFRIHLWDAELADSTGRLLANDHLDLLDYTIAEMERRGIDVILTAQTNFGNGYPERNTDTGAFTYDFDKCRIHDDPAAQRAQARYLDDLVRHVNPYTGLSYAADPRIVALEINNEPCHSGTRREVTRYIDRMAATVRKAGFRKPVLYNVSHNPQVREAYYDAKIDGTTYQWYPVGLVSGRRRKGNMLPSVDAYDIPWEKTVRNFSRLPKVIYEFDPGDELDSYLYPAIVRTLRGKGFQWITQFAYDPIDLAPYNTEYQTHYLNLAYTPRKAVGMAIAAEAMKAIPRGADYGTLPADTVFGPFRLSYRGDLAEMNTPSAFLYTNTTASRPVAPDSLRRVAGTGSSAAVGYEGNGAYFLDRLPDGVWRLEVMPDVVLTADPFAKPSLSRRFGHIIKSERDMRITLPSLGSGFAYRAVNAGNDRKGTARGDTITVYPGVYLLGSAAAVAAADPDAQYGHLKVSEYVAPEEDYDRPLVEHTPAVLPLPGSKLRVVARVYSKLPADSVVLYPGDVSFWRDDNKTYRMERIADGVYATEIEAPLSGTMTYSITVATPAGEETFPAAAAGNPLSWDWPDNAPAYSVTVAVADAPVSVVDGAADSRSAEMYVIPSAGASWSLETESGYPHSRDRLALRASTPSDSAEIVVRKYLGGVLPAADVLDAKQKIEADVELPAGATGAELGFVTRDGLTYTAPVAASGRVSIPLGSLRQTYTDIVPEPYPYFMRRRFESNATIPFRTSEIEFVTLRYKVPEGASKGAIGSVWLE